MVARAAPRNETVVGTEGPDILPDERIGEDRGQVLTIIGLGGDDTYYIRNSNSEVIEASGGGFDKVLTRTNFELGAGQEVELLIEGWGRKSLVGNELPNHLIAMRDYTRLSGRAGNDRLDALGQIDTLVGGSGNDVYYVAFGNDEVLEATGEGIDTVYARVDYSLSAGQEIEALRAFPNSGALTLTGNEFANFIVGGSANDVINGGEGDDGLSGRDGNDTLSGGAGADKLSGGAGRDLLYGGEGNDRLDGGKGSDAMTGGSGNDVYYVDNAADRVVEAAGGGNDAVYAATSWVMAAGQEIETLKAHGLQGVSLAGNEFANRLFGGASSDTLDGGAGNDTLVGGGGGDRFLFDTALVANVDTIADFDVSKDMIQLDRSIFTKLTNLGTLSAAAFRVGTAAQDGNDYVIYNPATRDLFYDNDGNGANAAVKFAHLNGTPTLTNTNFTVVA